jgi:NAD(P)-dependent dehydrogenase (short-subunit alcohol dehydrogenase family)
MNINKKFPKKRIIITGSGSGIGLKLALEFARMNWRIAIAEINKDRAEEASRLVSKEGGKPLIIQCDVTKPEDLKKVLKTVEKEWGGVDILVNNAGVAAGGYFEDIPLDKWEWILAINQKSIIYGCRTFIPLFKKQKSGYIVNVASNAGIASLPLMASYNMTKAAAISMSETLKTELHPFNIGVSAVCPTFVNTNLLVDPTAMDERTHKLVDTFFDNTAASSEKIARHIVKSIQKNRLYVITQRDGKFMWRMKRWFPELYFKVLSYLYKKELFDKYLAILLRILNFKLF